MWLFDDILKKPTAPAGQANSPTDPLMGSGGWAAQGGGQAWAGGTTPVIVKSETSTVFWPDSEAEAIRFQNTPPSVPTVHAEEDSSSILMSSSPASTPIAPVAPLSEPMVVAPIADAAPAQTIVASSSIDLGPAMVSASQGEVAPIQNTPINVSLSAPSAPEQDALQIPAWPSLFDHIMREDAPVAPATPATPVTPATPATPVAETQAPVSFQFEDTVPQNVLAPAATPAVTTSLDASTADLTSSSVTPMTPASNYATPREFIEKSLENIDVMLETIDGRHSSKMTEAEWYRMEKMRFAELEKNAYAEAEIMDRERDHTLRMKSIFERELETDEANRTKKTVVHQEAHAEKHAPSHKRHVHEEEEDLIAAS